MSTSSQTVTPLDRRAVVAQLLAGRADALLIAGLGGTTWDAAYSSTRDSAVSSVRCSGA